MRPLKFSKKQRRVLTWWRPSSPDSGYDAILCEGAVRSGKTLCTGLSFFCWAMTCFAQKSFALCGKSVPAVRRNLWQELRPILREMGFQIRERLSQNRIDISLGRRRNTFYLFGGLDERSAALVQGITLAGALLDEAALMPRSFVEQVCARCSVEGSRLWFSCNPESPAHWFYQEWVQKAREKNVLRLSFTMEDNPGLSRETIRRYEAMFQGAFYRRFILGEWAQAEGLIYDFFGPELVREAPEGLGGPWYISCDYGTVNPTSMGLWGRKGGVWYRAAEFYYDSRRERRQKTDGEYAQDLDGRSRAWWWTPPPPAFWSCSGGRGGRWSGPKTTCSPASAPRRSCCGREKSSSAPPAGMPSGSSDCTAGIPPAPAATGWSNPMTTLWTISVTSPPRWRQRMAEVSLPEV